MNDRDDAWHFRKLLKKTQVFIKEDLPQIMEERVKSLIPICKEARKQQKKAIIVQDQLIIDGVKYNEGSLHTLPMDLRPEKVCNKEIEDTIFFGGKNSKLSNVYPCEFTEEKHNV